MRARALIAVSVCATWFSLVGQGPDKMATYTPDEIGKIRVEYAREGRYEEWISRFREWQRLKGSPRTHADSAVWYALQAAFAYTYFDLRNLDSAENILLPVLNISVSGFPDEYLKVQNAWGVRLVYGGRFAEAKKHFTRFREQLDTEKLSTTPIQYCNIVHNLGVANSQLGDYDAALEVFHHIEDVIAKEQIEDNRLNINLHLNLAGAYGAMKRPELSLRHARKSYAFSLKEHGPNHPVSAQAQNSIANGYILQDKPDSALVMYKAILKIYDQINRPDHPLRTVSLLNAAETLDKLKRPEEGLPYILECIGIRMRAYGLRHAEVARAYKAKGRILGHLYRFEEAIQSLDTALMALGYDANSENPYSGVDAMFNLFYTLDHKADIYYMRALHQPSEKNLYAAKEAYTHGIRVLNDLRNHFKGKLSKGTLNEKSYLFYEPAVEVCLKLYEKTGEESHLEQAMLWSSESKGNDFYDLIRGAHAMAAANIPDSIRLYDEATQTELAELESAWYDARHDSTKDVSEVRSKLDQAKQKYRDWLGKIEIDYPKYYELLHAGVEMDLNALQTHLERNQAQIIEYFVGDSMACAFILTPNALHNVRLSHPKMLTKAIAAWRRDITSHDNRTESLSALIWQPVISLLGSQQRLIVIPDGGLSSVPFEVLQDDTRLLALERFDISYGLSSRSVFGMGRDHSNQKWLGMAPSYSMDGNQIALASRSLDSVMVRFRDAEWTKLPGAEVEIEQISQITGGQKRIGKNATERYFRNMAHDFGILHLSMHAWTDDDEPLLSTLIFSPEETDSIYDGKLYAHEIFQLDLPARLTVLSACNTGVGTFRRGEGISSLARAFHFAGAEATLMSLWKVPDESTAMIMQAFYRHLRKGMRKDEALRQAKIDYLASVTEPEQRAPHYWAGFVLMGDPAPVYGQGFPSGLAGILGGILLLGGLMYWLKGKQKERKVNKA